MDISPDIVKGRGVELLIVQLIFLSLAIIFTLLRAYVKIVMVKQVALDDYLMFLSTALYAAYGGIIVHGVLEGISGTDLSDLGPDEIAVSLRAWYLGEVLYPAVTLALRVSVCVTLLRFASAPSHRWIIWANLTAVSTISVSFFFLVIFQCQPVSYFWRQALGQEGRCIQAEVVPRFTIAHSVVSALSDWCLGLLPVAILWHVNINRRTKAIVAVLLSMGMVAGIALIIRIPFIRHLEISIEFLFATIDVAIWSVVEPGLGIIAACTATFRPLFKTSGFGWDAGRRTRRGYTGQSCRTSNGTGKSHIRGHSHPHSRSNARGSSNFDSKRGSLREIWNPDVEAPSPTSPSTIVSETSQAMVLTQQPQHSRNWEGDEEDGGRGNERGGTPAEVPPPMPPPKD